MDRDLMVRQYGVPSGFTLRALRAYGFEGFVPVAALREMRYADVPQRGVNGRMQGGVYIAFRRSSDPPRFLPINPGRWRRDYTMAIADLERLWVARSHVVYIGKADATEKNSLHARVRAYLRFGAGHRAPHGGGYRTWQLADSEELLIAWIVVTDEPPLDTETRLIGAHFARYGRLPFANSR